MVNYEEKFIVIRKWKISDNLSDKEQKQLDELISKANESDDFFDKEPHKYYVCNQDEPYAKRIIRIILRGERIKEIKSKIKEKISMWLFSLQCRIDNF